MSNELSALRSKTEPAMLNLQEAVMEQSAVLERYEEELSALRAAEAQLRAQKTVHTRASEVAAADALVSHASWRPGT